MKLDSRPNQSLTNRAAMWSLLAFVFTIPWEKVILTQAFGSIARIFGMIAVVIGALSFVQRGRLRALATPHAFLILYMTWAAVTYFWSRDIDASAEQALTLLQLLAMSMLIWNLCPEETDQMQMLQAYVLGTFVSAFTTFAQYGASHETDYHRYASSGFDPNDLALVLALSLPISYVLSNRATGKVVWVYRLQMLVVAGAIFLTASRGAIIASVVGLTIVPLTFKSLPRSRKLATVSLASVLAVGAVWLIPTTSWDRLGTTESELRNGDLNNRFIFWSAAWQAFQAYPLQGVGAGAFGEVATSLVGRGDKPIVAHNTFLSVLVETGVIGFMFFCAFLGSLVFALKVLPWEWRCLWAVVIATWAVGVSALTWENRKPTWLLFSILLTQCAHAAKKTWMDGRVVLGSEPVHAGYAK